MTTKPYHLMTPAERTAARIAANRQIDARVAKVQALRTREERRRGAALAFILDRLMDNAPRMTHDEFDAALAAVVRKF